VAWQGSEGDVMVETEQRDGIRVLALRRPPVNAIDLDVARSLAEALRAARTDDACRGVVVTGMPGVFSAGIDTRVVPAYDASTRAALLRTVNRTILELYGLPKPTVAAISGHALGGALVVALACDVRLAARVRSGSGSPRRRLASRSRPARSSSWAPSCRPRPGAVSRSPRSCQRPTGRRSPVSSTVEPAALLADAAREAERLAAMPAYSAVKPQVRASALAHLRQIVEQDEEPLLRGWV
jgi:enoyl-CoA hydratase/carnithine racemase